MSTKSHIPIIFLSALLASCTSNPSHRNNALSTDSLKLDTFAEFISTAEMAAAKSQTTPVLPVTPFNGHDYSVISEATHIGVYTAYRFSENPCVNDVMVGNEVTKHGFVKVSRSSDPHGKRDSDKTGPSFHDLYRYGTVDGTRSINVDYTLVGSQSCVSALFIDFPE